MDRSEVTRIIKAIKRTGAKVTTTRIGTGRYQDLGVSGPHAAGIARALEAKGYRRRMITGDGSDPMNAIVFGGRS